MKKVILTRCCSPSSPSSSSTQTRNASNECNTQPTTTTTNESLNCNESFLTTTTNNTTTTTTHNNDNTIVLMQGSSSDDDFTNTLNTTTNSLSTSLPIMTTTTNNISLTSTPLSPKRTRKIYKRQANNSNCSTEQQIHLLRIQSLTMGMGGNESDESDDDDIVIPPPLTIHDSPLITSNKLTSSTCTINNVNMTTSMTLISNLNTTTLQQSTQSTQSTLYNPFNNSIMSQLPITPIRTIVNDSSNKSTLMIEEDLSVGSSSPTIDSNDKDADYVQETDDTDEDDGMNMVDDDEYDPTPIKIATQSKMNNLSSSNKNNTNGGAISGTSGRRKKRTNSSRTPIASHNTTNNSNGSNSSTIVTTNGSVNNCSDNVVDMIDIASGSTQELCCLKGCDHAISNRLRFSLRTCKDSDFKVDYMNKGFNWVCNYHYFHDLYLYKKSQKNANNSTTSTPSKRKRGANSKSNAKSQDPAIITPTVVVVPNTATHSTTTPNISVSAPVVNMSTAMEATITNMIPSLLHANMFASAVGPVQTVGTPSSTTKRKRASSNASTTSKKTKSIVDSVVLNTSMNYQTTSTPSSTVISSSKMTFGNTTSAKKKNLKVSTQELTVAHTNYAQPSPVNTDDVMALINFSMGI